MNKLFSTLIFICLIYGCNNDNIKFQFNLPSTDLGDVAIIPKPLSVNATKEAFPLTSYFHIESEIKDSSYKPVIDYLKYSLHKDIGLKLDTTDTYDVGVILLNQLDTESENFEAYELKIGKDTISINSNTAEGAFRALQTLRQIIPEKSIDTLAEFKVWPLPTGIIKDEPVFNFRSTMLDVSRHFFSVEDLKKYIDILAYYKINHLHLHLSDDQGWRIEIKSWPKLTEIGSKSEVGGGEGGFYTQEEYKEIVNYAADRFITIIPEIDMPGHTNAASVSYPWLNGNGKKVEPYTGMRVGFSTFDTRKDSVYSFIDDVVRELSAITPGPYFHIGGDESHVTKKEDYLYFVNRVEKIVKNHGKQMIGWDEVANADLDQSSIAQFWNSLENAKTASQKNMKIIISPGKKMYLDMKYNEDSEFGLTWAGMIPVDSAYIWSPYEYLKGIPQDNILGIEAPLWSETISEIDELEYLAFPRIIGYAELGWTADENRNWEDYKTRLKAHKGFLEDNNINFYKSPLIEWDK